VPGNSSYNDLIHRSLSQTAHRLTSECRHRRFLPLTNENNSSLTSTGKGCGAKVEFQSQRSPFIAVIGGTGGTTRGITAGSTVKNRRCQVVERAEIPPSRVIDTRGNCSFSAIPDRCGSSRSHRTPSSVQRAWRYPEHMLFTRDIPMKSLLLLAIAHRIL
jgi:hypothetical protein